MTTVAIVGAGTMGHGIAHVAAVAGYATRLTDDRSDVLNDALIRVKHNLEGGVKRGKLTREAADAALARITTPSLLEDAVAGADFIIEAVTEDLRIKQNLFSRLDELAAAHAVLATNTSSLSVTEIARATANSGRVIGMHFFNPVHIMKLVEIVVHGGTDEGVYTRVRELAEAMGKHPIRVRDAPGFASSRLGVVLGLEAMRMIEQDVATPEDIDKAMELGYGHPMGPLKVTDLVGLDVRLAVAEYLFQQLGDPHYEPPEILRRKVAAGELGKKAGKGFYEWPTTPTSS